MYWAQCSGVRGRLAKDPDYVCPRSCDQARPIDNRPVTQVDVDGMLLDVKSNFCYLEDMLCAGQGCKLAIVTRCSTAWGKLKKASSYSDIQACVPKDPQESLQRLCTFCPITF